MKCRFCGNKLSHEFIDLVNGTSFEFFSNRRTVERAGGFYPLRVFVCEKCFLVQIGEYRQSDEIFDKDYAYFSSYSKSWLDHAKKYVDMITERLGLNTVSKR